MKIIIKLTIEVVITFFKKKISDEFFIKLATLDTWFVKIKDNFEISGQEEFLRVGR